MLYWCYWTSNARWTPAITSFIKHIDLENGWWPLSETAGTDDTVVDHYHIIVDRYDVHYLRAGTLNKSLSDRFRSDRNPVGPITDRYWFKQNTILADSVSYRCHIPLVIIWLLTCSFDDCLSYSADGFYLCQLMAIIKPLITVHNTLIAVFCLFLFRRWPLYDDVFCIIPFVPLRSVILYVDNCNSDNDRCVIPMITAVLYCW